MRLADYIRHARIAALNRPIPSTRALLLRHTKAFLLSQNGSFPRTFASVSRHHHAASFDERASQRFTSSPAFRSLRGRQHVYEKRHQPPPAVITHSVKIFLTSPSVITKICPETVAAFPPSANWCLPQKNFSRSTLGFDRINASATPQLPRHK